MLRGILILAIGLWSAAALSQDAEGKGLDELSEPADPNADAATAEEEEKGEPAEGETSATAAAPARKVTEKMYLATSFGWVTASRSEGDWKASGMSDVTFGYRLPIAMGGADIYGTYRYAPVVVAGEVEGNSYRGVWDFHYFGALGAFNRGGFDLTGTFEIGYGLVYLDSVDGIELNEDHEENGVSVAIGGGADWEVLGEKGFKLGPRLAAGFGGFSTIQFGASMMYMF